jgi:large subunit ribosomal protein L31e
MAEEIEKIYIIPLKNNNFKSSKAAPTAIKRVRNYLTKHMKVDENNIWIDESLNHALWKQGKYKMKSRIRVKAVKFEDGVVEAYLPELEFKKSRRELLKEEKEKKTPILVKEEAEEAEGDIAGAEDFDISPTADGEVKIKKKKQPKETTEKKDKTDEKTEKKKIPPKKVEKKAKTVKKPKTSEKKKESDKKEKTPKKATDKEKGKTEKKKTTKK